jgi:cell division protein FtsB
LQRINILANKLLILLDSYLLQFVADNISASLSQRDTIKDLEQKMSDISQENDRLKQDNERLKKEVDRLKGTTRSSIPFVKTEK